MKAIATPNTAEKANTAKVNRQVWRQFGQVTSRSSLKLFRTYGGAMTWPIIRPMNRNGFHHLVCQKPQLAILRNGQPIAASTRRLRLLGFANLPCAVS